MKRMQRILILVFAMIFALAPAFVLAGGPEQNQGQQQGQGQGQAQGQVLFQRDLADANARANANSRAVGINLNRNESENKLTAIQGQRTDVSNSTTNLVKSGGAGYGGQATGSASTAGNNTGTVSGANTQSMSNKVCVNVTSC